MCKIRGVLFGVGVIGLMVLSLAIQPTKTQMEPVSAKSQPAIPLAPFNSIELNGGAKAVVQYGSPQRVTMLKGSEDLSLITVTQDRLVIEKCRDKCPRGYELQVEIVTPLINSISVANGGRIESLGSFPLHTAMSLAVSHGGMIDARAISANSITAGVNQGGKILAQPQMTMVASVSNGGVITYWGNPQVTSSTQHGGAITKGAAGDLEKPLFDVDMPDSCSPTHPAPPPARAKRSRTIFI
jgi:hypothetical protein